MGTDRELSLRVEKYIRACFHAHTPPQAGELAAQLGIARFTLNTQFGRRLGIGLGAYFKLQQLAYAIQLLRTTDLTVAVVGRAAAFGTERNFHRAFRRVVGMTPGAYRASAEQSAAYEGLANKP